MNIKRALFITVVFVLIWVLQAWLLAPERGIISLIDLIISGFHLPSYVAIFFASKYLFTKSLNISVKTLLFLTLLIVITGFSLLITNEIDLGTDINIYFVSPFLWYELGLIHLVIGCIGFGFGGIQAAYATMQLEKEVERLKKLEAQSREKNLIQHLQPHFLFNALNTIYALARKHQPETPQTILELADLLRYSLDASKKEQVSLAEEIHFLNAYCDFQQKRLPLLTRVEKHIEISDFHAMTYPLLFQPIVENAFKYVDSSREGVISITWKQTEKELYFSCSNPISES